ncbi:MAG: HTH-type transcriptional activator Btr [Mucilaginibacter sp.]|nr:HTH-type transcriptional activator Btr [Mucilaginibacter sp.]
MQAISTLTDNELASLLQAGNRAAFVEIYDRYNSLLSEAKNLLIGADITVAEIAYQLGFENPPYFSRLFKKETGFSPVTYRNQHFN